MGNFKVRLTHSILKGMNGGEKIASEAMAVLKTYLFLRSN